MVIDGKPANRVLLLQGQVTNTLGLLKNKGTESPVRSYGHACVHLISLQNLLALIKSSNQVGKQKVMCQDR